MALLLVLAGCVWAETPPPAVLADQCASCAEDQACDQGECTDWCVHEDSGGPSAARCVSEERECFWGECEVPCADEDCPGGYRCDPDRFFNKCMDYCYGNSDCRSDYYCCDSFDDSCDYGECTRRR